MVWEINDPDIQNAKIFLHGTDDGGSAPFFNLICFKEFNRY